AAFVQRHNEGGFEPSERSLYTKLLKRFGQNVRIEPAAASTPSREISPVAVQNCWLASSVAPAEANSSHIRCVQWKDGKLWVETEDDRDSKILQRQFLTLDLRTLQARRVFETEITPVQHEPNPKD